ncbi:MAG: hypothetical protein NT117_10400 [Gammaproteobacteria bacterium]|nr:hypothetical protein [Gammaproteobacteria bacterium]
MHVTIGEDGRTCFAPRVALCVPIGWTAMIDVEKARALFRQQARQQATALRELAWHEPASQRVSQRL